MKKKTWIIIGVVILILIVVGSLIISAKNGVHGEIVTAEHRNLIETVRIAGQVQAKTVANIGFDVSGRVQTVSTTVNARVRKGDTLVTLDIGELVAELRSAQADVAIQRATMANNQTDLQTIKKEQDTLVANVYSKLLSEGLEAEADSRTYTQTPPIITGRYSGMEGTYKVRIERGVQTNVHNLFVFDLEKIGPTKISDTAPTPLGTRGLFIDFPDDAENYYDTTWYVTIPNTKSSSYATNYNTYQEALDNRTHAIQEAEAELKSASNESSVAEAELARAEAAVNRIQAQISARILRAPFNGIITAVNVDPGEAVSAANPAISIISDDGFGVEVDLPEIDSIKVSTGDSASIILDAFGKDVLFPGKVSSINHTETLVDGISIYEARIAFDTQDSRISSGMTADVTITTNQKEHAIAIPSRALQTRTNNETYVILVDDEGKNPRETPVTTGLESTDGYVEILSGLSEGEKILVATE